MARYARINENLVAEIFETDNDISEMFHPDIVWVDVSKLSPAPEVGWSYSDSEFSKPVLDYKSINNSIKQELRLSAESNISVLQYAVDLGMATEDESRLLTSWKKYLVLISRVNTEGEVDWPEQPASAFN
ncbi:tail fiber assembly protein [Pantoea sp. NPDC088449]|uniref:tail fiber assembly protein n=1 Tax=Pantoea sp. NPDC088449 TaxID=3364392 RepID=UPI00380EC0C1